MVCTSETIEDNRFTLAFGGATNPEVSFSSRGQLEHQSGVRSGRGGRLTFGPNKSLGENWEGEAPAEPTVQRFGRSLTLPLKLQAIPKRKRDGLQGYAVQLDRSLAPPRV